MKYPVTQAIRALKAAKVSFVTHVYTYEERGGTSVSARELGVSETCVIKTLVFKDSNGRPFVILMPGDREVSTKKMARFLGVKAVVPCTPSEAQKYSGYLVGGTSPFGLKRPMPIYMEQCIQDIKCLYINGGKRGFLVSLSPFDLLRVLSPEIVQVGLHR